MNFQSQDFFFNEIPQSAHLLQAEHGSKRAEMRRYLDGKSAHNIRNSWFYIDFLC